MDEKNTPPLPANNSPSPKKGNSFLNTVLGIVGLILVILIIGLGALLAGHRWDPAWNPFKPHLRRPVSGYIQK